MNWSPKWMSFWETFCWCNKGITIRYCHLRVLSWNCERLDGSALSPINSQLLQNLSALLTSINSYFSSSVSHHHNQIPLAALEVRNAIYLVIEDLLYGQWQNFFYLITKLTQVYVLWVNSVIFWGFSMIWVLKLSQHTNSSTVSLSTTQLRPLILKNSCQSLLVTWQWSKRCLSVSLALPPKKCILNIETFLSLLNSCVWTICLTTNQQNTVTLKGTFSLQVCFYSQSPYWCTELFETLYAYFTVFFISWQSIHLLNWSLLPCCCPVSWGTQLLRLPPSHLVVPWS